MKLEFGKVTIHNFLSYEDEEFDFSANDKMNLICGKNLDILGDYSTSNGSGKSQLVQSLVFALFGQTLNRIKTENIPNRYLSNDEPCLVKLWFKADNIQYRVESGLTPKYRTSICSIFKIDGNKEIDLSKSSLKETRKFIENEILKCNISIFLRTILLTSDQTYNFFNLRAHQKKEFIEHIFDLTIFGEMYKAIHKDNLDIEKEIYALQKELLTLNTLYSDNKQQYDEYLNNNKDSLYKLADEIKKEIDILKSIDENNPSISKKIEKLEELYSQYDKEFIVYKNELSELKNNAHTIKTDIHSNTSILTEKINILKQHSKMLKKLCNDCKPAFDEYYNLTETTNISKKLKAGIISLNKKLEQTIENIDVYENKIKKYSKNLIKIKEKIDELNNSINDKQALKNRTIYKIKLLKEKFDANKNMDNPYHIMLNDSRSKLTDSRSKLTEYIEKIKYLKYAETIVSQDTLRKFIIGDLISLLNIQIRLYLSKMCAKFTCEFDNNMDYIFITENGETEYNNFSSGEKMKLAIATSFAFRDFMATRSNIISNILILDEYIDSNLDTPAINELIKILREFIVKYNQSIYIVSHRKEINNDIFNNIIVVEKKNGISRIKHGSVKNAEI
jgi:DNA repair exonuclease SbcCD ATPase subunit